MVVGVVLILVAAFLLVLMQLLSAKSTTDEQTVTAFPESGDRTDLRPIGDPGYVPFEGASSSKPLEVVEQNDGEPIDTSTVPVSLQNQTTTDWRETIVSFGGETATTNNTSTTTEAEVYIRPTYSVDDLVADGLVRDYEEYYKLFPIPDTFTLGDGREISMDALDNQEAFADAINPIPTLDSPFLGVKSCGTLQMPSSESGVTKFYANLSEYEESTCLGEAVLNDCEPAWTRVNAPEGVTVWVYVVERSDGVCSVGVSYDKKYANLCAVAEAANVATQKNLTLNEWRELYADTPAQLFAEIFGSQILATNLANLNCVITQID